MGRPSRGDSGSFLKIDGLLRNDNRRRAVTTGRITSLVTTGLRGEAMTGQWIYGELGAGCIVDGCLRLVCSSDRCATAFEAQTFAWKRADWHSREGHIRRFERRPRGARLAGDRCGLVRRPACLADLPRAFVRQMANRSEQKPLPVQGTCWLDSFCAEPELRSSPTAVWLERRRSSKLWPWSVFLAVEAIRASRLLRHSVRANRKVANQLSQSDTLTYEIKKLNSFVVFLQNGERFTVFHRKSSSQILAPPQSRFDQLFIAFERIFSNYLYLHSEKCVLA